MGFLNLFNKKQPEPRKVDHMNDQKLKDSIKEQSIIMLKNEGKEIDSDSNVEISFKYLDNVENSGLESMYTLKVNDEIFYFAISKDAIQLLDDSAKSFFEFDEEE